MHGGAKTVLSEKDTYKALRISPDPSRHQDQPAGQPEVNNQLSCQGGQGGVNGHGKNT